MAFDRNTALFSLAVGALVGFALGTAAPRETAPSAAGAAAAAMSSGASEATASDASPAPPTGPSAPTSDAATAAAPRSPPSTAATPRATTASAFAAAVAAIAPPEGFHGTSKVTGSVLTKERTPVAGATITLTLDRSAENRRRSSRRRSDDDDERPSVAEQVERWAQNELRRRASTWEAKTDAAGAFSIEGLPERKFTIHASAKGYEISRDGPHEPVAAGAVVAFTAKAQAQLEATVIAPDGSTPARVTIILQKGGSTSHEQWSAEEPSITVNPGTYVVSAKVDANDDEDEGEDSFGPLASATQRIELVAGGPAARAVFELKGKPSIRGRVIFPEDEVPGERIQARIVAVRFVGKPPAADELENHPGAESAWASSSNRKGAYEVDEVTNGSWIVGVSRGHGQNFVATQIVEVADGPVRLDLTIPPVDRMKAIALTVLGPGGEPIEDFEVDYAVRSASGGSATDDATVVKLRDGTTLVVLDGIEARTKSWHNPMDDEDDEESAAPPVLTVTLTVTAEGFGAKTVTLAKGQRSGAVTVQFGAAATLDATVLGYAGSDLAGRLALGLLKDEPAPKESDDDEISFPNLGSSSSPTEGALDADGKATLGPVEAGRYVVLLYAGAGGSRGRYDRREVSRTPITLRGGKNDLTLPIPTLYTLTVEAPVGTHLQMQPAGHDSSSGMRFGGSSSVQIGKSGRGEFANLPAGRFKLSGYSPTGQMGDMEVTVPAAGAVVWKPAEYDALKVRITNKDGALAKAGFEDGDLIIAIEGTEFTNMQQMQMAFMGVMAKEAADMTVLRGADRLNIVVDPKTLMGGRSQGGNMQPAARPK